MGLGLRLKEKVKQVGKSSSQPDKSGFMPTTYDRTQLTYEEAVKFADGLKIIRRRISEANHARTKMLRDVEATLTGPLPCIHEIDPVTGEHTTAEAAPEGSANYVHTGTLTRLSEESDAKLQTQVFDPIDKWISEVDLFKGKMKVLEKTRLELDGSRRDHINIENKIVKQENKVGEVDAKHTTHIQSKDASVAGKRVAFEQLESQLYEELQNIVGESGVLHNALDRALKLEIECFQRALAPISSTTSRLENLSMSSASPTASPHGSAVGVGSHAPTYTSEKPGFEPAGHGQTSAGGYGQGQTGAGGYGQVQTGAGGYGQGQVQTGTAGYGQGQTGAGGYGQDQVQTGTAGYGQGQTGAPGYGEATATTTTLPSAPTHSASGAGGQAVNDSVARPAAGSNVGYEKPYAA